MNSTNIILLKLIREASGFTQSEFAEKILKLPQTVLSKLEHGVLSPSDDMLKSIAENSQYPIEFFREPFCDISSGLIYHRKRSSLKAFDRTRIESRARLRAFDAVRLARSSDVSSNLIAREGRSPVAAAQEVRQRQNIQQGPIDDMVRFLENLGVMILAFDFETDKLDGFFIPIYEEDGREWVCIALNTNAAFSVDRQRFTLAHEFGHAILHRKEFPDPNTVDYEAEANEFAAELLFPKAEAIKELVVPLTFTNLKNLKLKWRMSMSAIARRARDVEAVSDSSYRKTLFFLQSSGYRKREPLFGLAPERPVLLETLMNRMIERGQHPDDILHLSPDRFTKRYKDFKIGGPMT